MGPEEIDYPDGPRILRKNEDKEINLMENRGEGKGEKEKIFGIEFQVAAVKKPLIAVKRIVEKGNRVLFGPKDEDNYILNQVTGDRINMKPNGRGSYLLDVNLVGGGNTKIVVDSGAEENVCPYEWAEHFGLGPADRWLRFRDASGNWIEHFGKRVVMVTNPF